MSAEEVSSGFVALVGRPNAGKSTLVNALLGSKVAITSDVPQTTRHRLRAIIDRDDGQIVLVDTPGLHKPHDALGEELNRSALKALEDVDVVAMLIDASKPVGTGDAWVANHVARSRAKRILVLSKSDLVSPEQVAEQLARARGLADFDDEVVVSAHAGHNLDAFTSMAMRRLPHAPRWFPRDMGTDQPFEVMVAEFIREKALRATFDEVPYAVGVAVESIEQDERTGSKGERTGLTRIYAVLFVERESQKGIIVGKGGERIKLIGSQARADLERLVGTKVFLDLRVKVKKEWRRDASQIRRFGYGEGL